MTRLFTIFLYLPSSNTIEIKSIINPLKVLLEVEEASRKQQRLELKVIMVALTKMRFVNVFFLYHWVEGPTRRRSRESSHSLAQFQRVNLRTED